MLNIIHNGISFLRGETILKHAPLKVWIEITNRCNRDCDSCLSQRIPDSQKQDMSLAQFSEIMNKMPARIREVNLFHRGEPLLHKDLIACIDLARKKGKFIRLYTNGMLLGQTITAEQLLEACPDMIAFSISHPFSAFFSSSEQAFQKAMHALENLLAVKSRKHMTRPYIKIETLSETPALDRKAQKHFSAQYKICGLDKIAFRKPHNWGGSLKNTDLHKQRNPGQCTFPWYSLVIFSDGTVTPCPQDFFGKMALGNIFQDNFENIWNGPIMISLRHKHACHAITENDLCYNCDRIYRRTFCKIPLEYLRIFFEKK